MEKKYIQRKYYMKKGKSIYKKKEGTISNREKAYKAMPNQA